MRLSTAQRDRAAGVLLATAAGDALGAGYEFGPPLPAGTVVAMSGGGSFGWAPGEWTDDTSMAIVIAQVAADGHDLRSSAAQNRIAAAWAQWATTAPDVGNQTRAVFAAVGKDVTAAQLHEAATAHHECTGRSGGNGSLMRTAPVALAYLHDEKGLVEAATALSALTHHDPEAGEACALWCLAIRHAVLTGELDIRVGLAHLHPDRAAIWAERLDVAENTDPSSFTNNGWVVEAFQAAWSAISRAPVPIEDASAKTFAAQHLQLALAAAVRGGHDTDTVAAIAGGLLGATWGACAVPASWRRILHGWPGLRGSDLVALADRIATGKEPFAGTYAHLETDVLTRHPDDRGVWIGAVGALTHLPAEVDCVVSLCRVRAGAVPDGIEHIEVRLIDEAAPEDNPHLEFVLHDTVSLIETLRAQGRTVFLHCVQAQSRTPTVAALYGARVHREKPCFALDRVKRVLSSADPNTRFANLFRLD